MIARYRPKQSKHALDILDAIRDRKIFAEHFEGDSWVPWIAFLCALFALPMTKEQTAIYRKHTGRKAPPTEPLSEAWLVCGRRAGKSFVLALVAVFLACFKDWRPFLGPGEHGTIMIIARDRRQARVIKRFVQGLLDASPMLRRQVVAESNEGITLRNRVVIEIHTASFRAVRGYTLIAALLDEIAFWPSDENSASPDEEVLNALRPGMATIPGAMLLCASSPYARRGELWNAHRKHFGKDGDPILVWKATTREMNATVPQRVIDEAMEADPNRAAAEYNAEFRADVEAFVSREIVHACVSVGTYERPPLSSISYKAFLDFSGGSGQDSMTLAIGHKEGDSVIVDALREVRPPFSPEFAIAQFATLLKTYKVYTVEGDNFGGEFAREPFKKHSISYVVAKKPKSDLYVHHLLPMLNSGRIDLLDHPRSIQQICGLEAHTARAGKDKVDHAPGGHDDLANSIAGLVARTAGGGYNIASGWLGDEPPPPDDPKQRRDRLMKLLLAGGEIP
jgi:Terminase large subunit, T4likevirus-type, N-terminal